MLSLGMIGVFFLTDLSVEIAGVGKRDQSFPLQHGRGSGIYGLPAPDPRDPPLNGLRKRHIMIPDLHFDTISLKTRDFR